MFAIDYILFVIFSVFGASLLIGTTKREKKWIGGSAGLLAVVFIIISQLIKFQSGYFYGRDVENAEVVGNWIVLGYILMGIYLLGLLNYRLIKTALRKQSWARWGLIIVDILVTLLYLLVVWFGLFIIAFTYFPFAP